MIEVDHLQKSYGATVALRDVSFSVKAGEVVGLLGPNGAGKTTAMKILVGYLLPGAGRAVVAGYDVTREPIEVQKRLGYLPENAPLYGDMLVQEFLDFMSDMRDIEIGTRHRRLANVVEECGIGNVLTRPIGQLSKGYRQRVGLASAILHDPDILILDEPTTGLDPNQIIEVRELIRRMGQTKTVILSTHILPEVEESCGRAVILIDGRVRADGSLDDLTSSRTQVVVTAPDDPGRASELFKKIAGVQTVEIHPAEGERFQTFRLRLADGREVGEQVAAIVREQAWPLRELRRDERSLEQVFRELTGSVEEVAA
ncbi:MAG: ATP-binding cassette domain-containing protein [Acidobacteriota bacterium]